MDSNDNEVDGSDDEINENKKERAFLDDEDFGEEDDEEEDMEDNDLPSGISSIQAKLANIAGDKKHKTEIDDEFFSLRAMETFCDNEEMNGEDDVELDQDVIDELYGNDNQNETGI